MSHAGKTPALHERIQGGAGRRKLPLPTKTGYTLAELLPRRASGPAYRVPGDMGPALAAAFERTFAMLGRAHGDLLVQAPSRLLSPRWHAVFHHLVRRGLARELVLSLPLEKGVPLYYFDVAAGFQGHRTDGGRPTAMRFCRGFSDDYDHALAKVVGECMERCTLLYYRMTDLVRGSARALSARGMRFLAPGDLSVFVPWQMDLRPELRWDDDAIFGWCKSRSLLSGEEVLVPAQLVYWNYHPDAGDVPEPFLRERSTHGAGAFYSIEGAILSGLLECVQRDGFFTRWLTRRPAPRIDPAGITRPRTLALIAEAKKVGLDLVFFDITSELGIPTCLAGLVRKDEELPWMSMGASCRIDGETAIFDAILEAASVHHVIAQSKERFRLPPGYAPFSDPAFGTPRRLAFWANPEHKEHLEFFLRGETITVKDFGRGLVQPEDARASLALVRDALRRHGQDAYYVEAKHEALDELGYAVARVIAPGMVPMYCEDINAPLGHPRVRAVMGESRDAGWPPWPHPFP